MAQWAAIFGGFGGRNEGGRGNIFTILLLAIITPIIATLIQLAISRSREYLADASGARLIKDPKGLANALSKLEHGCKARPMRQGNPATSSLFIVNPFAGGGMVRLLSTHPPTSERIKRLMQMKV